MPLTSRYYETERDFQQMQAMLMEARLLTDDWRYAHIGDLIFRFFIVECHLDPQQFIRLWHDPRGNLAAYAIIGEDPSFDCQVMPDYAWRGIDAEALDWAEERLHELRKYNPKQWGGELVTGARETDTPRISLLELRGFHYSGKFAEVNMLQKLDESVPKPVVPDRCEVRSVIDEPDEISNRAGAHRQVWLPWGDGNISDENYARFMQLPGYDRHRDVVAVAADGEIASFVNCWIDPLNRIGNLGPVGARPAYRRQGLTRAALLEGLRRMKALGMNRACVSTGVSNTPARLLYESIGFRVENKYLDYVKAG